MGPLCWLGYPAGSFGFFLGGLSCGRFFLLPRLGLGHRCSRNAVASNCAAAECQFKSEDRKHSDPKALCSKCAPCCRLKKPWIESSPSRHPCRQKRLRSRTRSAALLLTRCGPVGRFHRGTLRRWTALPFEARTSFARRSACG